jgi:hypothetical protein
MSTPTPSKPAMASKSPSAPSKPIEIFQTQPSQLIANLHPILLLSVLIFSFKSLVNDPVNTLIGIAPTIALVQAIYCVVCLPSTGQAPPPPLKPGQKRKAASFTQDLGAKVVVCSWLDGASWGMCTDWCLAGVHLPCPDHYAVRADTLYYSYPLWRTAYDSCTTYTPTCHTSCAAHHAPALLRARLEHYDLDADRGLTITYR